MTGRGTLIVILGFALLFGIASKNWNRVATSSVDNFLQYYDETMAHSIAISAANLGANQVFVNQPIWKSFQLSGPFSGGKYSVKVDSLGLYRLELTATGTYPPSGQTGSITDTVRVEFGPDYFSSFGLYTSTMNNVVWNTGDTIWGNFHSEGTFNVEGTPVFFGRVTSNNDISGGGSPIVYGSFQTGISIPMPDSAISNIKSAAAAGGTLLSNPYSYYPYPFDVYMTINSNSSVTYHTNYNTKDTTIALSTFAPNGVIFVNNGNLHVHGTVKGQVTVAAGGSPSYGQGNVYINGNVTCNTDPTTNTKSLDMIGIVAQNSVWVESDNAYLGIIPTYPPSNPLIEAAIYAANGAFQCYYATVPAYTNLGSVKVFGSITNKYLGVTGNPTGTYGYKPAYRNDPRFSNIAPPSFPVTGTLRILSWYE
jgi:cytoskeletal protein CcmA (bactofilin family)